MCACVCVRVCVRACACVCARACECVLQERETLHDDDSCNTLQHTTTHCNALQHTATHCNTLQGVQQEREARCNDDNAYDESDDVHAHRTDSYQQLTPRFPGSIP